MPAGSSINTEPMLHLEDPLRPLAEVDQPELTAPELGDFRHDTRLARQCLMGAVAGALSVAVAWLLLRLIGLITNLAYYQRWSTEMRSPAPMGTHAWAVAVPVVGGLIVGVLARFGSEKIRGHGIPEAIEAILIGRSRMEAKVAVLKPLSSAVAIGTGGPFGAEGPIIMTGGAVGSLFAQRFALSAAERKALLVAGAAGGMSAVFGTPLAAILLAVELLLFEWRPRSLLPVAVAATVASALRAMVFGPDALFATGHASASTAGGVALAFGWGLAVGAAASGLTTALYAVEAGFRSLPLHWMGWPALGGLVVGLVGLAEPSVLGVGYDQIRALLAGELAPGGALAFAFAKAFVWIVALGSGTSGGVLAPLLLVGGALGAAGAAFMPVGTAGFWAMLGMGALIAGAMRAPLTAIVFTVEATQDYGAMPAVIAACAGSYLVAVMVLRRSILTEKIARRGLHLSLEFGVDPLEVTPVRAVMDPDPPVVDASLSVAELSDRIARGDEEYTRHQAFLILGPDRRLLGIVTRGDLMKSLRLDPSGTGSVLQAGHRELIVCHPDDPLRRVVEKMVQNDIGRLPVVPREQPNRPLGYVGRSAVLVARARWMEQDKREHGRLGWWRRRRRGANA